MDQNELLGRLTVSLAIGLLVGLERGWRSRNEEDHQRPAGFRTFALSGLLGGVAGAMSLQAGGLVIGFVFLGYAAAFFGFHWLEAKVEQNLSVTSVVAGLLTFLLGAMSVIGDFQAAIACAVAMTVLLAFRETLHKWVASLTWPEIRAVLALLVMSFLLLPLLPNRRIDPWDSINPYQIWLLAILVAGVSFVGYIAVRAVGDRLGILMTAVAGGLASSTATTLAFARLGKEHPASSRLLSAGILIAGVVMMVRVGAVAIALNGALLTTLALPLASAAVVLALGATVFLTGNVSRDVPKLRIDNPMEIGPALKLAVFIAAVMMCAEILRRSFGDIGVLVLAALSGVADVDAVTISMARLDQASISTDTAVKAIVVAVAVNTLSKAFLSGWAGGRKVGFLVGGVSVFSLAAGLLALHAKLARPLADRIISASDRTLILVQHKRFLIRSYTPHAGECRTGPIDLSQHVGRQVIRSLCRRAVV